MIDAIVSGHVYGTPTQRTGASGRAFTVAKVRTAAGNGESTTVQSALLALDAGDSVALAGSITVRVWIDREGQPRPALDMVAHQVLTAHHVARKRKAMQPQHHGAGGPGLDEGSSDCAVPF